MTTDDGWGGAKRASVRQLRADMEAIRVDKQDPEFESIKAAARLLGVDVDNYHSVDGILYEMVLRLARQGALLEREVEQLKKG